MLPPALPIAAMLLAAGCAKEVQRKESTSDTTNAPPVVTTVRVNSGSAGITERVSWLFSGDRKSVLVVTAPFGIEAEAMPKSFVVGDENTGFQLQMDTVWDVAVSPDWKSVAFSRAFYVADGGGTVDPVALSELARRTSIDSATLRASAFPASGMSDARAIAQPGIIRIPSNPRSATAGDSAAPKMFPIARGWQIRWTTDGALLALGSPPPTGIDRAQSVSWASLDPKTGELHGSLPATSKIVEPAMFAGPVLHSSGGPDMTSAPTIRANRGGRELSIVSERGVITITAKTPGDSAATTPYVVGPGIALAATAGGTFIVAIAPRAKVGPGEPPAEVVVYRVGW